MQMTQTTPSYVKNTNWTMQEGKMGDDVIQNNFVILSSYSKNFKFSQTMKFKISWK